VLDGVMTKFPPPLRFTIPALIVASGFSLGAIKLALEVQDLNRRSEQSAAAYLKSSVSQAARMVDYLYRTDDEGDQVLALISQLGTNPGYRSVILFNEKNIVLRSSDCSLVGQPLGGDGCCALGAHFCRLTSYAPGNGSALKGSLASVGRLSHSAQTPAR